MSSTEDEAMSLKTDTARVDVDAGVATVTLTRPGVHNAFNAAMIDDLHRIIDHLDGDDAIRVVVLTGEGRSFCAGADLEWMRSVVDFSFEDNLAESLRLFDLMHRWFALRHPTVARVNGAAIGGGMGLVTASDIAIAAETAKFSLSEVKLGIVPAVISPFVIRKIGPGRARELFLTGDRIDARTALEAGLVNRVASPDDLDAGVSELVDKLRSSGPRAMAVAKGLVRDIPSMTMDEAREHTARCIADLRISDEGQEGMAAFLEKRRPAWVTAAGEASGSGTGRREAGKGGAS